MPMRQLAAQACMCSARSHCGKINNPCANVIQVLPQWHNAKDEVDLWICSRDLSGKSEPSCPCAFHQGMLLPKKSFQTLNKCQHWYFQASKPTGQSVYSFYKLPKQWYSAIVRQVNWGTISAWKDYLRG